MDGENNKSNTNDKARYDTKTQKKKKFLVFSLFRNVYLPGYMYFSVYTAAKTVISYVSDYIYIHRERKR